MVIRSIGWLFVATAMTSCTSPVEAPPVTGDPIATGETVQAYRDYVYVTAWPRDRADVDLIWRHADYVLTPHDPALTLHELVVRPSSLARLQSASVPVRVEPIDVQAMIDASYAASSAEHPHHAGMFGAFFARVEQLDAIHAYLDELAALSQGRARVVNLGKSIQNRDIKAIRISSAQQDNGRASVIVTGTQHAREWASPMVTSGFADGLVRQYDADPKVKWIVDNLEVFIIPVVNPDGYVASHAGMRLQRKNMNPKCNVDLNRNWGEWWGLGVPRDSCMAETFPGDGAFSEPETQAVRRLAESRTALRYYMDYHSDADQAMFPMCFEQAPPPNQAEDIAWTQLYSQTVREVHGVNLPARPCFDIGGGEGGCSHDWFRKRLQNVMEIELPPGGSPGGFGITDAAVVSFVEENWAAWLAVLTKVADKNVTDGGTPVPADSPADAGRDDGAADSGSVAEGGPSSEGGSGGSNVGGVAGSGSAGASGTGVVTSGAGGVTGTGGHAGSNGASGSAGISQVEQGSIDANAGCSCRVATRQRDRSSSAFALVITGLALVGAKRVRARSTARIARSGVVGAAFIATGACGGEDPDVRSR